MHCRLPRRDLEIHGYFTALGIAVIADREERTGSVIDGG
jgi:hypothetical protein